MTRDYTRHDRDNDDRPAPVSWPDPCRLCAPTDGLRELAWHRGDRSGAVVVDGLMAACDCALGQARAERTRDLRGRRTLGTVGEVWGRLVQRPEHVTLYLDPTVGQRVVGAVKASQSEAIAHVRKVVEGMRGDGERPGGWDDRGDGGGW